MNIHDDYMRPCPRCGGMVVMVDIPLNGIAVWCTECEEVLDEAYFANPSHVAERWNEGMEPPVVLE